jgi:hypothetical protein
VRCLLCDTQMQLVEVIDDTTLVVTGYKRQIWRCSTCGDVERRMVFTSAETVASNVLMSQHSDEPPTKLSEDCTPPRAWDQAVDKLPIEIALEEREKSLLPTNLTEDCTPGTAWKRAADKLRKRETTLEQRVLLAAKVSDRIRLFKENFAKKEKFDQLWDNLVPRR